MIYELIQAIYKKYDPDKGELVPYAAGICMKRINKIWHEIDTGSRKWPPDSREELHDDKENKIIKNHDMENKIIKKDNMEDKTQKASNISAIFTNRLDPESTLLDIEKQKIYELLFKAFIHCIKKLHDNKKEYVITQYITQTLEDEGKINIAKIARKLGLPDSTVRAIKKRNLLSVQKCIHKQLSSEQKLYKYINVFPDDEGWG